MNAKKNKEKKTTSGTKYLKTHVHRVISKWCSPTPNLISNFETHKNVGDNFYFVNKYIYASSKQSLKKFKGHF